MYVHVVYSTLYSIEEGFIQKRKQRSALLFGHWWTEFIKFLAALAILHQDDLKNRTNSSFSWYHCGAIHPFLHIIRVQNSYRGKELNKICPPKQQRRPLPSLLERLLFFSRGGKLDLSKSILTVKPAIKALLGLVRGGRRVAGLGSTLGSGQYVSYSVHG